MRNDVKSAMEWLEFAMERVKEIQGALKELKRGNAEAMLALTKYDPDVVEQLRNALIFASSDLRYCKIYTVTVYYSEGQWPLNWWIVYSGPSKKEALQAALREFRKYDEKDVWHMSAVLSEWKNGRKVSEKVIMEKGRAHQKN